MIDTLLNSRHRLDRRHLYLGVCLWGCYPVLIPLKLIRNHLHLVGASGAGKTTLLAQLVTQLAARGNCSIVVVDLKGENSLFQTALLEASRAGLPVKWFRPTPFRSTFAYNPLLASHLRALTLTQRVQGLLQPFGLDHGDAYGKSFFSAMSETTLANYLAKYRDFKDFVRLFRYLNDPNMYDMGPRGDWLAARHLPALLNRLASIYALNLSHETLPDRPEVIQNAIDPVDVLLRPQLVYFYLPSIEDKAACKIIARLFIHQLLAAASRLVDTGKTHYVYLFIDEFATLVGESFSDLAEKGRSLKVPLILSHQTLGQLKHGEDFDLTPIIEAAIAVQIFLSAPDPVTIKYIQDACGERLYQTPSWSQPYDGSFASWSGKILDIRHALSSELSDFPTVQVHQALGPVLEKNFINEISTDPTAGLVRFLRDADYAQFRGAWLPFRFDYAVSAAEHEARAHLPWPEPTPHTVITPLETAHDRRFLDGVDALEPEPLTSTVPPDRLKRSLGARFRKTRDD